MMSPGLLNAGGPDLDPGFTLDHDDLPGTTHDDFLDLFEDCAATFIVEKCHAQPEQRWSQQTIGGIVLKTLKALAILDGKPLPVPVDRLILTTTLMARQIVPARCWAQTA